MIFAFLLFAWRDVARNFNHFQQFRIKAIENCRDICCLLCTLCPDSFCFPFSYLQLTINECGWYRSFQLISITITWEPWSMRECSSPEGRRLDSQACHQRFFKYSQICAIFVNAMWEKNENKQKRGRVWPIFKYKKTNHSSKCVSTASHLLAEQVLEVRFEYLSLSFYVFSLFHPLLPFHSISFISIDLFTFVTKLAKGTFHDMVKFETFFMSVLSGILQFKDVFGKERLINHFL